jgi:hypothetical protein
VAAHVVEEHAPRQRGIGQQLVAARENADNPPPLQPVTNRMDFATAFHEGLPLSSIDRSISHFAAVSSGRMVTVIGSAASGWNRSDGVNSNSDRLT